MEPTRLRCLIVDDSADFRASLRGTLEAGGITVVGTASTLDDAVRESRSTRPDVALVDIDLGEENGFAVVEALQDSGLDPVPAVVLVSTHDEEEFADLIDLSAAVGRCDAARRRVPAPERGPSPRRRRRSAARSRRTRRRR
ncbi:LytR/AlgR family response regulator transcription factor [Gordonia rubripertincta]|uniref:LytR/AlgR family response regulator transcription factor n=1 Tax=Gordonia rubripertincta TaxID=36822 RepID=UPI001EF837AE|nr:response regulator [Gordonia rubripertincta]